MGKAKPRYDVHFWNLDYLEAIQLQTTGELKPIITPEPDVSDRIVLLSTGDIATVRNRDKVLEVFRPHTHQRLEIHRFHEHERLTDMVAVQDALYLWEAGGREIVRLDISNYDLVASKRWFLDVGSADLKCLAVMRDVSGSGAEAYLAPTSEGGILAVKLDASSTIRYLPPPHSRRLDKDVYLCADARARTLIVTEPKSQRITEIDAQTGELKLLWTPNSPVRLETMGEHFTSKRSRPCAVAIYRTRRIVSPNLLKPSSRGLLESDQEKILPRTLLIADYGNFCIWKLVQLPNSALLLELSGMTQLLAFIGSGLPPQVTRNFNPSRHEQDNLRRYALPPPSGISVSSFGEVLVRSDPEYPLLLLRPATSRAESSVALEAKMRRLDWSD